MTNEQQTESCISRVAVCGAGAMGLQIAMTVAQAGKTATLFDVNREQLVRAQATMEQLLEKYTARGRLKAGEDESIRKNLEFFDELPPAVEDVDLVIEAIVEDLQAKENLFQELEKYTEKNTILATNSSSIVSSKLTGGLEHPERVCNLHFFNPAMVMPLVEVVKGPHTDGGVVDQVFAFTQEIEKKPIRIEKEVFGFVTNRLLSVLLDEAIWLLENGVASIEDIDTAAKAGLNHPMGPFELLDFTGIDINYGIKMQQAAESGDESQGPSETLKTLMNEGKLGKKSGEGFYSYPRENK
ncbi:3-hydroxyacyl-CoA dehydrogenase family protein [Corynebacterium sp.]|uniref:3-hydroxyacyl-CoA dehydrogenase family protein n=1 Tax=Corynebacterium sp. TaxID=1720 RepID=UPI0028AD0781|nr:3-hydroxyacyl-CoA dehydrogenase family protein [Corynebacterium sp.]